MKNHFSPFLPLLIIIGITCLNSCVEPEEDKLSGTWLRLADFPGVARYGASSFVVGGKGYIIGGVSGLEWVFDLWEYDKESGSWTQLADFTGEGRLRATAFSIDTKGYCGLGRNTEGYLNDFWEYDPSSDLWTRKADFIGLGRLAPVGFGIAGKGYIGTGYDESFRNDFFRFDPADNSWTPTSHFPGDDRFAGASFIYNNEAYLFGGTSYSTLPSDFWKFDTTTQSWIKLNYIEDRTTNKWDDNYINLARSSSQTFVIGDKAYITLGGTTNESLRSTWQYDFASDRWYQVADFEGEFRSEAVCFSFGDRGVILTGKNNQKPRFNDVWEFRP